MKYHMLDFLLLLALIEGNLASYSSVWKLTQSWQSSIPEWQGFTCKTTLTSSHIITELTCVMTSISQLSIESYAAVHEQNGKIHCILCGPNLIDGLPADWIGPVWMLDSSAVAYTSNINAETTPAPVYFDCQDALNKGQTESGIYRIQLSVGEAVDVWCEQQKYGGGWLVFQQRQDGSVDFYRGWQDYKNGFGDLKTEFWLGNDALNLLTEGRGQSLKIELNTTDGLPAMANYDNFYVENEAAGYKLHVSGFSGTHADDALSFHNGGRFSSSDRDNDQSSMFCAQRFRGPFWHTNCMTTSLNGEYCCGVANCCASRPNAGIIWKKWSGISLYYRYMDSTRMMIRGT